jgi:hypothetical protein
MMTFTNVKNFLKCLTLILTAYGLNDPFLLKRKLVLDDLAKYFFLNQYLRKLFGSGFLSTNLIFNQLLMIIYE